MFYQLVFLILYFKIYILVDAAAVHVESQLKPTLIQCLSDALNIHCSWGHTCVVTSMIVVLFKNLFVESGDLYTFGSAEGGRLGLGDQSDAIKPTLVESLKSIGRIENLSLGDNHCGAIINGSLYTWGKGAWVFNFSFYCFIIKGASRFRSSR